MPDQVRHDAQKISEILNYDTASQGRGDDLRIDHPSVRPPYQQREAGASPPVGDCVANVKTTHQPIFVIPGSTRNPVLFQTVLTLDAGSGLSST
jgi:hypothetical protein